MSKLTASEVLDRLELLDLGPIRFKLACPDEGKPWSRSKIAQVEIEYRRFLFLNAVSDEQVLVPTRDVDKFWHAHILDTRKYAQDCNAIFGHFLHHFPYLGARGPDDVRCLESANARSKAIYKLNFGESMPEDGEAVVCGSGCSSDRKPVQGGNVDLDTRPYLH